MFLDAEMNWRKNLATLMKTKLRAPSPEISSWGIRLRRFGKCPLLENFRSLSAWRARLRSWRSWSCSLLSLLCQTSLCFFGKWDASTYTPQEYARAETPLYDLLWSRQNGVPLMKMTLWAFFRSLMHCWKRYPLLSCIRFRLQIPHKALILSQLDVNYEPCKSFWKASEVRQEWYL